MKKLKYFFMVFFLCFFLVSPFVFACCGCSGGSAEKPEETEKEEVVAE